MGKEWKEQEEDKGKKKEKGGRLTKESPAHRQTDKKTKKR
jgi:hypothetical protein